jgi:hypothetical protein
VILDFDDILGQRGTLAYLRWKHYSQDTSPLLESGGMVRRESAWDERTIAITITMTSTKLDTRYCIIERNDE